MRMTERRRVGGVAAVVVAFWLGFVCGGGGSLSGAGEIHELSAAQPTPAPVPGSAVQPPPPPDSPTEPPEDPAPVAPSEEPGSAAQPPPPPDSPAEPPEDAAPAAPPEEPGSAAQPPPPPDSPAEPPEDPAPAGPPEDAAPAEPPEDADPTAPPEDPASDESTQADAEREESVEADPEMAAPAPEPPLVQERPRVFTANTGALLYFVSPGGETAFEETLSRAAEALAASESEERRAQAEGWRTYKAEEPLADGVLLYVSWLDPVVRGADYWIPDILDEAFPTEAQALYETYAGAFADGQILLNLTPVAGP